MESLLSTLSVLNWNMAFAFIFGMFIGMGGFVIRSILLNMGQIRLSDSFFVPAIWIAGVIFVFYQIKNSTTIMTELNNLCFLLGMLFSVIKMLLDQLMKNRLKPIIYPWFWIPLELVLITLLTIINFSNRKLYMMRFFFILIDLQDKDHFDLPDFYYVILKKYARFYLSFTSGCQEDYLSICKRMKI